MSVRFFEDCLLCHRALSSLRADIFCGLPTATPGPLAQGLDHGLAHSRHLVIIEF